MRLKFLLIIGVRVVPPLRTDELPEPFAITVGVDLPLKDQFERVDLEDLFRQM